MIKEEHIHEEYECLGCGWIGEGVELTSAGECPECYAELEDDLED